VPDDELQVLYDALAAHRSVLMGAREANDQVDVGGALAVHAGLSNLMTRWSEFSAAEQREVVRTIEYLINSDDEQPDFSGPDGFRDDLAALRRLQAFLGYV
jgi:hypothetical protein